MGVGTPRDLLEAIGAGVDMFDCVLPTRNARNGQALTRVGRVVIKQARYAKDDAPHRPRVRVRVLRAAATRAPTCGTSTSRARCSSSASSSLHNLHFYGELVAGARAAIAAGTCAAYKARGSSSRDARRRI